MDTQHIDQATSVLKFVTAACGCAWGCYTLWRRLRGRRRDRRAGGARTRR